MKWLVVRHKDMKGNFTVVVNPRSREVFVHTVDEQGTWDDDPEFDVTQSPLVDFVATKVCSEERVYIELRGNPNVQVIIGKNLEVLENNGFKIEVVTLEYL